MSAAATVRVMSPGEISAQAGGSTPALHWPERDAVFAERAMRLRQRAQGHAMGDFLQFMAELSLAQQAELKALGPLPLPDAAAVDAAARQGLPPLPAVDWPRDPAWHGLLQRLLGRVRLAAPPATQAVIDALLQATPAHLERQADGLLHGLSRGLNLAEAPLIAAALQVLWTHLLLGLREAHQAGGAPVGRLDDPGHCPACGSPPTASLTRTAGNAPGQRYLHCALCSLQWHRPRTLCPHCGASDRLAYYALDTTEAGGETGPIEAPETAPRLAQASVQVESCGACQHYLKMVHADRDPFVEPVADDLASLTLDLLVSETGLKRHGHNLMLIFGEADEAPPEPTAPPGRPA